VLDHFRRRQLASGDAGAGRPAGVTAQSLALEEATRL
jgi:hypothetical protein